MTATPAPASAPAPGMITHRALNLDASFQSGLIADLCQLIRMPSRSTPLGGEEGELQRFIARRLRADGARVRTFLPTDIPEFLTHPLCCGPQRSYVDRPTVLADIGPPEAPALLVLAHSDTVPVFAPDDWSFSPFLGEVRGGKVCGLGSTDDKWGGATMLTLVKALSTPGAKLRKRIIFASTIDEESGVGNGLLLFTLAGVRAEAALYLDGMDTEIWIGNGGGSNLYLRPKQPASDGMLERHVTALQPFCNALSAEREALFQRSGPGFDTNRMRARSVQAIRRHDATGAHLMIAFYTTPGEERPAVARLLEEMVQRALGEESKLYQMSYREPWFIPVAIPMQTPFLAHVQQAYADVHQRAAIIGTAPKQDSFVLNAVAKIPTVTIGIASRGDTRGFAHQPDEQIDVDSVWKGCRLAYNTIQRWLQT